MKLFSAKLRGEPATSNHTGISGRESFHCEVFLSRRNKRKQILPMPNTTSRGQPYHHTNQFTQP
jgi:hypothetical protein